MIGVSGCKSFDVFLSGKMSGVRKALLVLFLISIPFRIVDELHFPHTTQDWGFLSVFPDKSL